MRGRGGVAQGRGGAGAGRRDAAAERRGGSEHRLVAGEEDSQKKKEYSWNMLFYSFVYGDC